VATATGEDTFLRHLQHNDLNYALRLEKWTFGKEKADAAGPRLSGLTAGGIPAVTIDPARMSYAVSRGRKVQRREAGFTMFVSVLIFGSLLPIPRLRKILLTVAFSFPFLSLGFVTVISRPTKTSPAQDER